MIYKGMLNKCGGGQGDSGDLMVFLFDHALQGGNDILRVFKVSLNVSDQSAGPLADHFICRNSISLYNQA